MLSGTFGAAGFGPYDVAPTNDPDSDHVWLAKTVLMLLALNHCQSNHPAKSGPGLKLGF